LKGTGVSGWEGARNICAKDCAGLALNLGIWGRNEERLRHNDFSNSQALNLGMFYEDRAAKKRWVMRSNDAKTLQEIDAVFVTVEPNGGSRGPSTQPLLFAYLRLRPNHP
jgi:hypothetical protein